MPKLGLDSTAVLRMLLHFSPKKKRLFKQKLAAQKAAKVDFVTKGLQRKLTQPLSANTLGLGPAPRMQFPRQPFTEMTLGETARKKFGPDRVFKNPMKGARTITAYAHFTRTQQAALRSKRPATIRKGITRKSTLPANWATNYMSALRFIGGKEKKDPEAKKALHVLRRMSRDLYVENRGEAFIPRSDSNGYYPVYGSIPYNAIQTAIRKNTSKRVRWASWLRVAASGTPYKVAEKSSSSSLTPIQQQHLLAHASIGLPHKKGRYPALLGQAVPGQLLGRSGSVIKLKDIDPEEWAKGGFTPMKFAMGIDQKIEKQRSIWKKILPKMKWARKAERLMIGPPNISKQRAHVLAKRLQAPGYKTIINKKYPAQTMTKAKLISSAPHAATIAHEATHSRQHAKFGKGIGAAHILSSGVGTGIGATLAMARASRLKRLRRIPRWAAPAAIVAGSLPRLGLEAHAAWKARKFKGGKRAALATGGSYLVATVAKAAAVTGLGHGLGRRTRAHTMKRAKMRRGIRQSLKNYSIPQDLIVCYENGIRKGLAKKYGFLTGGPQWILTTGDWTKATHQERIQAARSAVASKVLKSKHARGLLHRTGTKIGRRKWAIQMKAMRRVIGPRYNIPQDLVQCYENGIKEGLAKKWRGFKWKVKQTFRPVVRWTRMKLLPAVSEGAVTGTITSLHQSTGMLPPTTIDLQPIKILALSSAYRDIPDDALRALITGLRSRYFQEIDLELRRALQKKIADIQVELQGRRLI